MFKYRMLHKMKIYDHKLPPLLMHNPYSKFILVIETLSVDRFSKFLQVLLQQIEISNSKKILPKNLESDVRFYTLTMVKMLKDDIYVLSMVFKDLRECNGPGSAFIVWLFFKAFR